MAATAIMTLEAFVSKAEELKLDLTNTKDGVLTFNSTKFEALKSIIGEANIKPKEGVENMFTFRLKDGKKTITYEARLQKQVHEAKDKDIKVWSGKAGEFGVKVIYHRLKDGEKQYRIFISYKANGKLVRRRLVNDEVKKFESDEKGMVEYAKALKAEALQKVKTA